MKLNRSKWSMVILGVVAFLVVGTIVWASPPASPPTAPPQASPGLDADKVDGHHAAASWWGLPGSRAYKVLWAAGNGQLHPVAMPLAWLDRTYVNDDRQEAIVAAVEGALLAVHNSGTGQDVWGLSVYGEDAGLYATSLDGPPIRAHLGVTGGGLHGFNHTIVATSGSTYGHAALLGSNESTGPYGGGPGVYGLSQDGSGVLGEAGRSDTGPILDPLKSLAQSTRAGVMGYSTVGPGVFGSSSIGAGGYFTATNAGLYATSFDGPAIQAELWVSPPDHGFNHTIIARNGCTQGLAALLGSNESPPGPYSGGPGIYGLSQSGSGVLGEAGRSGTGPILDPLKSLAQTTRAGVMGYSTVGPGVYATSTVTYSLYVDGDAYFTGNGYFAGDAITNADIAENYYTAQSLEPGDVVVLDPDTFLGLRRADRAYDTAVAGVVSGRPTIRIQGMIDDSQGVPLALVGRVPVKADASYGAIRVGDLLTTSPTQGHAMLCPDPPRCVGAIVGKALEPLREGRAVILMLVTLQ